MRQVGTILAGRQGYVLTIPRRSEALVGVRLGSVHRTVHQRTAVRHRDNHHAPATLVVERRDRRGHGLVRKA
jgi:hypothetical protein